MVDSENAGSVTQSETSSSESSENDVVKYSTHSKLLGQFKRAQEQLKTLESQVGAFETSEQTRQDAELTKQGEYKQLLGLRDTKIEELSGLLNSSKEQVEQSKQKEATTWKLQAFYNKLPGKIKHNSYLNHVDLDSIVYDSETMSCDSQSVDAVVNRFLEEHSSLVEPIKKPSLPNRATSSVDLTKVDNTNTKDVLASEISKLLGA